MRTLAALLLLTGAAHADPLPVALPVDRPADLPFDVPDMHEEAEAAGLVHHYGGPWEYFVGGGVASFDCDGDRRPDVFLAGGAGPSALFVNRARVGGPLRFERRAIDVPRRDLERVTGAWPLDVDSDGHTDLVLARVGGNVVLRGEGKCRFSKANRRWSVPADRAWSTAFSAVWERDGRYPTLAIGNYVDRTAPGSPFGTCEANVLLRPRTGSDGGPDYSDARKLEPGFCALSVLFTDWNGTGEPALRVTNDRQYHRGGYEQMWELPADRPARELRPGDGWRRFAIWGMGIAEADLDNDGRPEYALTSMGDTKVQALAPEGLDEDRPVYEDRAGALGLTAHRPYAGGDIRPSTGWHAQFADVNNDARLDLVVTKGNVEAMGDFAAFDPDNMLLGGPDGRFIEVGERAGLARPTRGRGAVVDDFNMDGMLDMLVVNRGANVSLFRNRGERVPWGHRPLGNWLQVELDQMPPPPAPQGAVANRGAVGARIVVRTGNHVQTRTIRVGGGHASGQIGWTHFGLGAAERALVRVRWPDGEWSHEVRVHAGNFVRVRRGAANASYWYPID